MRFLATPQSWHIAMPAEEPSTASKAAVGRRPLRAPMAAVETNLAAARKQTSPATGLGRLDIAPQADVSLDLREWSICGRKPAWLLSGTGQKLSSQEGRTQPLCPTAIVAGVRRERMLLSFAPALDRVAGVHGAATPLWQTEVAELGECLSITHPSAKCYQRRKRLGWPRSQSESRHKTFVRPSHFSSPIS